MLGYISMPGGWEWVMIGSCVLIPAAVAVIVVLVLVKLSRNPPMGPAVTCGRCGQPNPATARFCSQCGQSLQNAAS